MFKHFTSKFLRGFLAILPILLSVYVLIWLLTTAERATRSGLLFFLPEDAYVPGLGILVGVGLIYGVGVLLDRAIARRVMKWVEEPFQILPLVRSVYQAIKDFTSYLSPKKDRQKSRVVLVKWPGSEIEFVGLVTRDESTGLPEPLGDQDVIAVYFPMSYQFGGYTVFVPRSSVRELHVGTEKAMRSVLTAWVSGQEQQNG